ncbi:MAG: dihydrolipoyllysine-residue acetyltransferase [Gammaproteobacteria bacterium 39-13]|nr:dihydrolipoyllysine-residue acetyltransferase [Gammaproteobacteria bacterium]OJV88518.1 MAG: dihydrolipoyllysine-residue acetyltransferase [Gammaproteobacteria bacterium 39-13]
MTTIKEVTVPDIGNFSGVEIIEVAVKPGMQVNAEDTLITLETEKASMDVPAPFAGKIHELKVKLGDKVSQGDLIALIETADGAASGKKEETKQPAAAVSEVKEASTPPQAPVASEPKMTSEVVTISVPDTGSAQQVEVIEVAVKPGDEVQEEGTLITLESEKASMDIPSPHRGKVESVLIKVGDKVTAGDAILTMRVSQSAPVPSQKVEQLVSAAPVPLQPAVSKPATQETQQPVKLQDFSGVHAGPATRRLARELGVDLTQVKGTGQKGRIITKDVQNFVKSVMQGTTTAPAGGGIAIEKAPDIDFSQFGEIEVKPLNRIKKWTAKNLHRNWVTIPHVTQFDEADITELEAFRAENKQAAEANGIKLTPLAFIMKACVSALKVYPQFNASLASNGADLVYKKYYHIGVAVDTPNGLVVPVVRDVDTKGLFDLARELGELSALARDGKLKVEQMQGSCFSISSLGGVGGTAFTPIINAPDVAILGVSKVQIKPVYIQEQFVPRRMLPLSLSYDHRVIDGAEAARFAAHIAAQLQDIRKLLL